MITLFTFGPFLGTPDSSPFVIKAMVLLKLAGLQYREQRGALFRSPKGLLPFIDDDGELVADSTLIRFHVERKYHFDFDAGLDATERAAAWAIEKMVEDHLYWALLEVRWTNRANFHRGIAKMFDVLPRPARPLARLIMRRRTIARTRGHGMGRHSRGEIEQLALRDLETLAAILADKAFLMGERPCSADAAVFGMVAALMTPALDSPIIEAALHHSNLVGYRDRIMNRMFAAASQPAQETSREPLNRRNMALSRQIDAGRASK
jgi:glutathione S-transferase